MVSSDVFGAAAHPSFPELALRIHDALNMLASHQPPQYAASLHDVRMFACRFRRYTARLRACENKHDHIGAAEIRGDLKPNMRNLRDYLTDALNAFPPEVDEHPVMDASEITKELEAVETEFGTVKYDEGENELVVTTEPITLEDIDLGMFEIHLELGYMEGRRKPKYHIKALSPNCAADRSDIPHPHVQDGKMCEGDATEPIASALIEGRLSDFFTLVNSVLNTYNEQSPYVRLDEWDGSSGTSCHECGSSVDDDDSYYCDECDHTFCGSCASCCRDCDTSICTNCGYCCTECGSSVCKDCRKTCQECEEDFCSKCLKGDLCPTCQEKKDEEGEGDGAEGDKSQEETTNTLSTTPNLGEASVPITSTPDPETLVSHPEPQPRRRRARATPVQRSSSGRRSRPSVATPTVRTRGRRARTSRDRATVPSPTV